MQRCFKFRVYPNNARNTVRTIPYPAQVLLTVVVSVCSVCNGQTIKEGTSVVAIVTDTEIAAAADSKLVDGDGKTLTRAFCKIRSHGALFFAGAHLLLYGRTGFDAYAIIANALANTTGSFEDKVKAAQDGLKMPLFSALQVMYTFERASYDLRIRRSNAPLSAFTTSSSVMGFLVFGMRDNHPIFSLREMAVTYSGSSGMPLSVQPLPEKSIDCPAPHCPQQIFVTLGETEEIDRLLDAYPRTRFFEELKPAEIAQFLVTLEAVTAQTVGTPIDVMRLSKDGPEWIQRKRECEEVKKEPTVAPKPKPAKRTTKRRPPRG